jgi:tetratricopeptide (TPR) repeat protein
MARIVNDQLIPFNSESYQVGIKQFEGNLRDILQMTHEAGVPVIIGTLVSNLKDQKPFITVGDNKNENADSVYSQALNQFAHNNNRLADSLFRKAKDLDALRFRAPEEINNIIKRLSGEFECRLVNVDSFFGSITQDGIVGNNLIVDHLHPSLNGYHLMGKIYFEAIQKNNLLLKAERIAISNEIQDSIVVADFAFSHLDSSIADIRLQGLLNDWPFIDDPNLSFIKNLYLKDRIDSIAYKVAVEDMNWEVAHRNAARWYLDKKDYHNFAKEFQVLVSQYPFKISDYDYAASQLINVKEFGLAYSFLLKRFKESPDAFSTKWLGNINLNNGNIDEAIKYLSLSIQYDNKDAQTFYNLAGAYIQNKDYKNALMEIENCLKINPDFPNAQNIKVQLTEILEQ